MTSFEKEILLFIKSSPARLAFHDITSNFKDKYQLSAYKIKKIITGLIKNGELEYTNELGHSFITTSFNRTVRLSEHIYVSPPGLNFFSDRDEDINIIIEKSTSFGRGSHPTTKLCLNLIEKAYQEMNIKGGSIFDIGCGTGVLCTAAVLLGMESGYAVDIDPVAIYDTKKNLEQNRIEDKVIVSSSWPENQKFNLICANLRPDALCNFKNSIFNLLKPSGTVIISGFKPEEKKSVEESFKDKFILRHYIEEREWGALFLEPNYKSE